MRSESHVAPAPRMIGIKTIVVATAIGIATQSTAVTAASSPPASPDPSLVPASIQVELFVAPFSYRMPPPTHLTVVADAYDGYALVDDLRPVPTAQPDDGGTGLVAYGRIQSAANHGLVVFDGDGAYVHPCPMTNGGRSRVPVGGTPETFLDGLDVLGGMPTVSVTTAELDGHPGLVATFDPVRRCETADIHLGALDFILLGLPSELTVVDLDGRTIGILTWASTEEALQDWLPTARSIIDSIEFLGR